MARYKKLETRSKRKQQQDFLDIYEELGNITSSCKKSKVPRRTIYNWIEGDAEFRKKFDESTKIVLGILEDEAFRRAVEGTNKPVFYQGKRSGYVKEYSDTLLIVLLKARAPEKYKERVQSELTGKDGNPITIKPELSHLTKEEIKQLLGK